MSEITIYEYLKKTYEDIVDYKILVGLNEISHNIVHNNSFESFIGNQDLCYDFIMDVLEDQSKDITLNKNRATHIVITWLLGIGFSKIYNLNMLISNFGKYFFEQIWLMTSITHDYGYFKKELLDDNFSLEMIEDKYNLLKDYYGDGELRFLNNMTKIHDFSSFFTYSYDEIKKYFNYRKDQLKDNLYEKNDHGITGGCLAFMNYCKNVEKNLNSKVSLKPSILHMQEQKIACITTASHNIFKSTEKSDEIYLRYGLNNLLSTSPIRVNDNNKLLLLLSLVDTVECTKKFSKKQDVKNYLQEVTILKKINISVLNGEIVFDFTPIYNYLKTVRKNDEMAKKLLYHVKDIVDIGLWTCFKTNNNSDLNVTISL